MTPADWFIIAAGASAIALNLWWLSDGIPGTTISAQVVSAATVTILVPAFYGTLGGHWFIPSRGDLPYGFWIMLAMMLVIIAVEVLTRGAIASHTHPVQWVLLWMALAPTLWPMAEVPR